MAGPAARAGTLREFPNAGVAGIRVCADDESPVAQAGILLPGQLESRASPEIPRATAVWIMYLPAHFEETRGEVLHELVRTHPLGALVTVEDGGGLTANHVPFLLDPDPGPPGTLRAHVARANPVWRNFSRDVECLVIFQGPQTYVTPSWYETKKQSGKVVPTYNYMVVHAHGVLRAVDDAAWLRTFVGRLTDRFEAPRSRPWAVTDAPEDFIAMQLRAIVGIEIRLSRLVGKWKTSQNRNAADRAGVVAGLREAGDDDSRKMADAVGKLDKAG
ncbi:MAG TPA: FMN-binding negative transcriptional regulator [Burkholderiales bacterium]|nr:FMN-binding negative transcriptional regulator [Burkholderiales bacterium]